MIVMVAVVWWKSSTLRSACGTTFKTFCCAFAAPGRATASAASAAAQMPWWERRIERRVMKPPACSSAMRRLRALMRVSYRKRHRSTGGGGRNAPGAGSGDAPVERVAVELHQLVGADLDRIAAGAGVGFRHPRQLLHPLCVDADAARILRAADTPPPDHE